MASRTFRRAVYAGSFDPLTMGHLHMIREGARLFDEVIVAVGVNPGKKYTFTLDERLVLLKKCIAGLKNVRLGHFENKFLVEYAREVGAHYVLRGIRNAHDFEFERTMRQVNGDIDPQIATVFLMPPRELSEVSSSFVKGLVGPKGWPRVVKPYLPAPIYREFVKRFQK